MKKILISLILSFCCIQLGLAFNEALPRVSNYSLVLHFFLKEQRIEAQAQITVFNNTEKEQSQIPFLLYRLLEVHRVTDEDGNPIRFSQTIQKFKDVDTWQVNSITVHLPQPLLPSKSITIAMNYKGSIFGYSEVMQYVRDRIDEHYSLIRPDALSYPLLSSPSLRHLFKSYESRFAYVIHATVPQEYVVACGGKLISSTTKNDSTQYVYESKRPSSRIDIAVAKFKLLTDDTQHLSVSFLPQDEQGAPNVLAQMQRAVELYSRLFGVPSSYQGYAVIQIPEGWGSQEGDGYILQDAKPFRGQNVSEIYHEIAHSWNVRAKPEVQRCRWFDEAFAMYFEALAVREFQGQPAFEKHMDGLRERWLQRVSKDKRNYETPIAGYGKEELGQNSYTKGAWSLYVLHTLVGDENFKMIIRTLLSEFVEKPADFKDFQSVIQKVSRLQVNAYFDEWIYGTESSRLLSEKMPVDVIIKRYR